MGRLGRWKFGFAFLLLLHLLVHPVVHVHGASLAAQSSGSHVLLDQSSSPEDVCSLCRDASSLHAPEPLWDAQAVLLDAGRATLEIKATPRAAQRSEKSPRAPPLTSLV